MAKKPTASTKSKTAVAPAPKKPSKPAPKPEPAGKAKSAPAKLDPKKDAKTLAKAPPAKPGAAKPDAKSSAGKPAPAKAASGKPVPAKPEVKPSGGKSAPVGKSAPASKGAPVGKGIDAPKGAKPDAAAGKSASAVITKASAPAGTKDKPLDPKSSKPVVPPPSGSAKVPAPKPSKTGGKGGKSAPVPSGPPQRYNVMTPDAMAASRAAAAKLAAAAGLQPVQSTANGDRGVRPSERLTKSPFGKKELAEFREMLVIKRAQIMGDVSSMESEALTGGVGGSLSHTPQHMADQGTDTFDQSLALDLVASQRTLLKEINDALARIDAGTYGICEMLGKAISVERLRHTPWARYCIEAARQQERTTWFR